MLADQIPRCSQADFDAAEEEESDDESSEEEGARCAALRCAVRPPLEVPGPASAGPSLRCSEVCNTPVKYAIQRCLPEGTQQDSMASASCHGAEAALACWLAAEEEEEEEEAPAAKKQKVGREGGVPGTSVLAPLGGWCSHAWQPPAPVL